ncbi:MAG: LysM peptidoglycan-binding domain-containing protein [Gemmataceae bacterium]|nr:LysM peptidoglycan-binding domain-containing protein [Gemmataceae bacterium]
MRWRTVLPLLVGLLGLGLVFGAACGGDDTTDSSAGRGKPITDPARVPSATPMKDPILYQIRGDTIQTVGGTGTVAPGTNATPTGARTYTVKSGDTCAAIAGQFGVSLDALLKANRSIDSGCTNIVPGDTLKIPTAATPAAGSTATPAGGGKTYTVKSGDTCDAIARNHGVELPKLIAANNLDADCRSLQPGQVLRIP